MNIQQTQKRKNERKSKRKRKKDIGDEREGRGSKYIIK
jgi:hypothetical protein